MSISLPHHALEDHAGVDENATPLNSCSSSEEGGGVSAKKKPRLFQATKRRLSQTTDALRFSFGSQPDRGRRDSFADKRTSGVLPGASLVSADAPCIGYRCKKGLKPVSPNQDSFCVVRHDASFLFGVFDGHGRHGHDVSHLVRTRLADPGLLRKLAKLKHDDDPEIAKILKTEFSAIQDFLVRETRHGNLDASASGTTATVVLKHGNFLHAAWVGDSRAVAVAVTATTECKELTRDHKPNLEDERRRIEENGGQVFKPANDVNHRVYVRNQKFPGLAMSRALGDLVGFFNAGISCEPEISSFEISDHFTHLVLCSDGVWEFIDSNECATLVAQYLQTGDETAAADALAKEAIDRWIKEEGGLVVDDVTVIVAKLSSHTQTA